MAIRGIAHSGCDRGSKAEGWLHVTPIRVFIALLFLVGYAVAQAPKVRSVLDVSEFVQDWKTSKQFTLDVANAMPAEFYSFKPNPEEMAFGEQMAHIARAYVYRFHEITGIESPLDTSKPPATDKESVQRMLEQSFDYVLKVLPQIKPEQLKHTWHIDSWKGRTDPDGRAMILNTCTPRTIARSARSTCE